MAVDQEVAAKVKLLRAVVRVTDVFQRGREQQHRGCLGLKGKRLGRSDAADVNHLVSELPPLRVGMKVVPIHAEVEIEHVPPDSLPGMCHDGWGIANERSSVEAKGREVVA